MKNDQEHEKRRKAVELYQQGKGFEKLLQIIHRKSDDKVHDVMSFLSIKISFTML